nr:hypothetical protein [Streptomyces sp. A012304]
MTEAVWPLGDGIRIDTHLQAGATVPPYYDSLLAKLIVHGRDRAEALTRLRGALTQCTVDGVSTNVPLHRAVLRPGRPTQPRAHSPPRRPGAHRRAHRPRSALAHLHQRHHPHTRGLRTGTAPHRLRPARRCRAHPRHQRRRPLAGQGPP